MNEGINMSKDPENLAKIPQYTTIEECYRRIYDWHKANGKTKIQQTNSKEDYRQDYLKLLDSMSEPDKVSKKEMYEIFEQVVSGLMEWSYHEEDDHKKEMAAYAYFGRDKIRKSKAKTEDYETK